MNVSRLVSILLVALLFSAALVVVHAAPQHHRKDQKHQTCAVKVYNSLKELCNLDEHSDYLRDAAARCCHKNCDLTEMMTFCVVASDF